MSTSDPKVALIGDLHGNAVAGATLIRQAALDGCESVVQLGDFGYWHGERGRNFLSQINAEAERADMDVYFIDGNHEDHPLLLENPY